MAWPSVTSLVSWVSYWTIIQLALFLFPLGLFLLLVGLVACCLLSLPSVRGG